MTVSTSRPSIKTLSTCCTLQGRRTTSARHPVRIGSILAPGGNHGLALGDPRLPAWLAVLRGTPQSPVRQRRPARWRLGQPGRHQHAAPGREESRDPHPARRPGQGPVAGAGRPPVRRRRHAGSLDRPGGGHRPPLPAVLQLPWRQGRGHCRRCTSGALSACRVARRRRLAADLQAVAHQFARLACSHTR